uniref:Ribosomal eL28/Mak16 domain-containing protein n=2 Tax=Phaeomonas parva TaxID=124430 RepID=A0A7S1Y069_9STRA|mmetsp:Transcript_74/g.252  ORF Transcript_74/g.252 Transcript_74/m.252 type:complete len:145 (+) Transcript_74:568-1002(+)|eukprot:CAMPEP_0118883452 /NCGR_PEP_ID=MMETSP1163-20130328/22515_1 /TAXON_ID=124430 /ORGANISM="Phaeomonas parva, Strain CCMP2877" /LENGTH=144 /DNA_ID=CAMNT_0006820859 /DNA_START=141 /DNA_END=575 /DNA_ORIENTATION=-
MASPNVIWSVISKNNSYVQRRNGRTRRSGAVALSGERGNPMNKHTFKMSGLANKQVFGLDEDAKTITFYVKTGNGKSPRNEFEEVALNKGFKAGAKAIKAATGKVYKRRDIEAALLTRFALAHRAASVQAGGRTKGVQKQGRSE